MIRIFIVGIKKSGLDCLKAYSNGRPAALKSSEIIEMDSGDGVKTNRKNV